MGKLHRKVIRAIRERFKDAEDALDEVRSTGRVTGVVISRAFEGLDFPERQERLNRLLRRKLTPEEFADVGPIAALTPAEATVKPL